MNQEIKYYYIQMLSKDLKHLCVMLKNIDFNTIDVFTFEIFWNKYKIVHNLKPIK